MSLDSEEALAAYDEDSDEQQDTHKSVDSTSDTTGFADYAFLILLVVFLLHR